VSERKEIVLQVRGLKAAYGRVEALHGMDFEVHKDEIVTLIGANGAGKTTTLRSIEARRLFPRMTVEENLHLGAYRLGKGVYTPEDMDRVFELFPRLAERRDQLAGTLSGGEQQMVAIGRGLMARPDVLMLDEPSMGLAPLLVQDVFRAIQEIHAQGIPVLLVEQNANQALHIATRAYVLETGRVLFDGPGKELLEDPRVRSAYLGEDL
jgi:branched-chain amino acid transport system ATP-binding protein